MADRLYFRQLLSGRDFATDDPVAAQMVNFVYLIGDRETGEAMVVDPAYDTDAVLRVLDDDGMRLTGVLVTHHHPDHVGGSLMGHPIEGVRELLARENVRVHVHAAEAESVRRVTGVSKSELATHDSGDVVDVGAIGVELLHTPGHTPDHLCLYDPEGGILLSGDHVLPTITPHISGVDAGPDPLTAFFLVATIIVVLFVPIYVVVNLSCLFYY